MMIRAAVYFALSLILCGWLLTLACLGELLTSPSGLAQGIGFTGVLFSIVVFPLIIRRSVGKYLREDIGKLLGEE